MTSSFSARSLTVSPSVNVTLRNSRCVSGFRLRPHKRRYRASFRLGVHSAACGRAVAAGGRRCSIGCGGGGGASGPNPGPRAGRRGRRGSAILESWTGRMPLARPLAQAHGRWPAVMADGLLARRRQSVAADVPAAAVPGQSAASSFAVHAAVRLRCALAAAPAAQRGPIRVGGGIIRPPDGVNVPQGLRRRGAGGGGAAATGCSTFGGAGG